MNPIHSNLTPARHWKDIPQEVKHRAMSSEGRRRAIFATLKTVGLIVTISLLAWGGLQLAEVFQGDPRHPGEAALATPVKDLVLVTDGVLDQAWLARTLALPKNTALVTVDLYQLRARLLACGQVQTAALTRNFPSTLTVTLTERPPVARLQIQEGGAARTLFVARDGVVYAGINYDPKMIESLPWVAGVKLVRQGTAFEPIAHMAAVADLLARAKLEAPELYADWRSVSLERLDSDGEIAVAARAGGRYIFSTREDYFRQLANLDAVLDAAKAHPDHVLKEIDLTVGRQVPVAVGPAADPAVAAAPVSAPAAPSRAPLFTGFNPP